jgi:multisubunit Na+/H+ antiporter MnhB subunit
VAELYFLFSFMIIGAIIAIEVKDLLSSVIAVGVTGLGVSLTFLVLKAPDLAITQLVVEVLCLIILIRATIRRDLPFATTGRWFFNTAITVAFIIVFLAFSHTAFKFLPKFGYPTMKIANTYLEQGLIKTGATNLISAIILDFRAYDTLGEATILFTAVIGVLAVMRKVGRKKVGEKEDEGHE